jgi:hypothetical protein
MQLSLESNRIGLVDRGGSTIHACVLDDTSDEVK